MVAPRTRWVPSTDPWSSISTLSTPAIRLALIVDVTTVEFCRKKSRCRGDPRSRVRHPICWCRSAICHQDRRLKSDRPARSAQELAVVEPGLSSSWKPASDCSARAANQLGKCVCKCSLGAEEINSSEHAIDPIDTPTWSGCGSRVLRNHRSHWRGCRSTSLSVLVGEVAPSPKSALVTPSQTSPWSDERTRHPFKVSVTAAALR